MGKTSSRQYNLDILKSFSIISMVICHPVVRLGAYIPGYEEDFLFFLGDTILGAYIFVAHGFMFAMGVGMIYSKRGNPSDMLRRGIKLYLMGYILNMLRYGIYIIIYNMMTGEILDETWFAIFGQDILQFAGLAFILTAILKKARLTEVQIFSVSVVLSVVGSFIANLDIRNPVLDFLTAHFFDTTGMSIFPLFNWYICVTAGRIIGSILYKMQDKDRFYRKTLYISGVIVIAYITLTAKLGTFFLSMDREYYAASTLEMIGLLSIDIFGLSVFHFILQKMDVSRFKILIGMSRNVTVIYYIHWMIVGATEVFFCILLGHIFTYTQIYLYAVMVLVVSVFAASLWRGRKYSCQE